MSRQSELAALARVADTGALSNRNLIINGAMQVAQRGTSFNAPADAGYTLDRISAFRNGAGVIDIEQSTVAPESFQYSLKVTVDTADTSLSGTDFGGLRYVVEGYDASRIDFGKSSAKQITLSFYARSSVTGIYSVAFRNSAASRSYAVDYTIDAVDTWERKEITITADTSGTWVTDSGKGIDLRFCLWGGGYTTAPNSWTNGNFTGSNNTNTSWIATVGNTFYITGIQLEVGDTATEFEHPRSYGDELAKCQRYYYRFTHPTQTGYWIDGYTTIAGYINNFSTFPVTMRASPTSSFGTTWTLANTEEVGLPTIKIVETNGWGIQIRAAATGRLYAYPNNASYIDFDAEL